MIRVGENGWAPSGPEFCQRLRELMKDLSFEDLAPGWIAEYDAAFNPEKVERETLARLKAKYGDE